MPQLANLPGSKLDSRLRTSWRVSMLKRPISPFVKDVTRWAGSLHTRSTEEGIPSSCTQKKTDTFMWTIQLKPRLRKKEKSQDTSIKAYVCLHWILRGRGRWCWRPTVSQSRLLSRRGGAGARCCTPNPKLSQCVHTTLHAASVGLSQKAQQTIKVSRCDRIWKFSDSNQTGAAVTVGVIGVNVGIGGVPALYSPINPSAETLLSCTAHHHAQYSPPVV